MNHKASASRLFSGAASAALILGSSITAAPSLAQEELDEFFIRVEINASDGDVGAHIKLDGEGWEYMKVSNPDGDSIYELTAMNELAEQGQTENFSESTEPLCFDPLTDEDEENNDEDWQTLAAFLARFMPGEYEASGMLKGDGPDTIGATYMLYHMLPAAPNIQRTDGRHFEIDDDDGVTIRWRKGHDFGECSEGAGGLVPAHDVELWEITVEPDVEDEDLDEAGLLKTVFTMQIPGNQRRRVTVPYEYFIKYLKAGITEFKFEIGAKVLENLTFSEGGFTVEWDD